jgi:hypothetical protein
VTSKGEGASINLAWPESVKKEISLFYQLFWDEGKSGPQKKLVDVNDSSTTVKKLLIGTTYKFTVRAVNQCGEGALSEPFSVDLSKTINV